MNRLYTYFLLGSLLWAMSPLQSKAQGVCDNVGSNGFIIKGGDIDCAEPTGGLKIEVEDKSSGSVIKYHYNYKGEEPDELRWDTSPTAHLPSGDKPIHYTILQSSEKGGRINYSCRTMTVHPGIDYNFSLCGGDDINPNAKQKGEIEIKFREQEGIKGHTIQYQIGSSKAVSVSEFPSVFPKSGKLNIDLPSTLSVFAIDKDGTKICESSKILEGGQGNPARGFIKELELLDDGEVKLTVTGSAEYDLFWYRNNSKNDTEIYNKPKDKVYEGVNIVSPPSSSAFLTNSYCFYISVNETCGGRYESPDICTTPLSDIKNTITENTVEWIKHNERIKNDEQNYTDNSRTVNTKVLYEIDDNPQLPIGENKFSAPNRYNDQPIDCKKTYCYQIETIVTDKYNGDYVSTSLSQKKCYDPAEIERSPLTDFYATVNNNAVEIHIDYQKANDILLAGANRYILYHRVDTAYVETDSKTTEDIFTYTDKDPSVESQCFKVGYEDSCGSFAVLSEEVCSIHLHADEMDHLYWTGETPFSPYIIQSYELQEDEPPSTVESFGPGQTDHEPDLSNRDNKIQYRILAIDENGNLSYSNVVEVIPEFHLVLPNAFSPNGDGHNDVFKIEGKTKMIADYSIEITNRWGNPVVRFDDDDDFLANGWDGRVNGKLLPPGVLAYQLRILLINGEEIKQTGQLFIVY